MVVLFGPKQRFDYSLIDSQPLHTNNDSSQVQQEKKKKGCFGKKEEKQEEEEMEEVYEPFVLNHINLNCEKGQLTAVVGHVGCGMNMILLITIRQIISY